MASDRGVGIRPRNGNGINIKHGKLESALALASKTDNDKNAI